MEVDIPRRQTEAKASEDEKVAETFVKALRKELKGMLKAAILFGSAARRTSAKRSDIDVLVLIDDISIVITPDVASAYQMAIRQLIGEIDRRLHVTTLRVTEFWDYMRKGDPIGINMLRDGKALYDTGFFEPMQLLLRKGRVRPSDESIWTYYVKAPATLKNAKWHLLQASVDLYWAVIDAAHAALMSKGAIPPTPEHVADLLDQVLVKKHKLEKKYAKSMRDFYDRYKKITKREIHQVSGKQFDVWQLEAEKFVERMKSYIKKF